MSLPHFLFNIKSILDEWHSSTSSENSRKATNKRFYYNYPTITLDDDDDDVVEIRDTITKRKPLQHASTPIVDNNVKRNGNSISPHFGNENLFNTAQKSGIIKFSK